MNKKILIVLFLVLLSVNIFAYIPRGEMKIFAVTSSNQGADANLVIEIRPGTGRIFSNVSSPIGIMTQESERNAVLVAERTMPSAKGKFDYFFEIQSTASSIDGPSAGGAMVLLLLSMLNNKPIENTSITGSITSDGYIGDVGGIPAKIKKAADLGIKLFMIPIGTRLQSIQNANGEAEIVNIIDYAYENWAGIKVVEVETIDDVWKYANMDIKDIDITKIKEKKEEKYFPEQIQYSQALMPMREIVDKYVISAKNTLVRTENNINTSKVKDSSIVQGLLSLVDYSKEAISSSEEYSKSNFLYTAANEAFLAKIYLITINEIVSNPSIISPDSTIYNLRIQEIEKKIVLAENRSQHCSLNNIEWCIGAKQRIVWAKNKIDDIKSNKDTQSTAIDKIMNYSYALAWVDIANEFLNIGITNVGPKFVESEQFKPLAQKYIVDIENDQILVDDGIAKDEDINRRISAAKKGIEMGWYVTALYDAASAKAVLKSRKENLKEPFDESLFINNYNEMSEKLRSSKAIVSSENVWSKMFFDHSLFHYKQNQFYESNNTTKAMTSLKTANAVLNISKELYVVESIINDYYNNAETIDIVISGNDEIVVDVQDTPEQPRTPQNVYVYKKEPARSNTVIYVIMAGLFLMIITIIIELEKHHNKKQKIQKAILELERKLNDGRISKFTYEDMKNSYLKELKEMEEKEHKRHNIQPLPQVLEKPKKEQIQTKQIQKKEPITKRKK